MVMFPFTDGSAFKKRPALIVSNESVNRTGDYMVIQVTSKINQVMHSIPIEDNDCIEPLQLKSFIRTHKIFTVHKSVIFSKITSAKSPFFNKVVEKIIQNIQS